MTGALAWWVSMAWAWEVVELPCADPNLIETASGTVVHCEGGLWRLTEGGGLDPLPWPTVDPPVELFLGGVRSPLWAARKRTRPGTSQLIDDVWTEWSAIPAQVSALAVAPGGASAWAGSWGQVVQFSDGAWSDPRRIDSRAWYKACVGDDQAWFVVNTGHPDSPVVRASSTQQEIMPADARTCAVTSSGDLLAARPGLWRLARTQDAEGWEPATPGRADDLHIYDGGYVAVSEGIAWRVGKRVESIALPCLTPHIAAAALGALRVACGTQMFVEEGGGRLSLLRQVGPSGLPERLARVWAVDLNNDRADDLIVTFSDPNHAPQTWRQANAGFVFDPAWSPWKNRQKTESYSTTGGIQELAGGDLDGDGYPEVVTLAWDGTLTVWRNRHRFLEPVHIEIDPGQRNFGRPSVVDVDGDGDQDILVPGGSQRNTLSEGWIWIENRWPAGNLTVRRPVSGSAAGYTHGVLVADLDGDTRPDGVLLSYWSQGMQLAWDLARGPAPLDAASGLGRWYGEPFAGWLTDADRDGNQDLLVVDTYVGPRAWTFRDGRFHDRTVALGLLPWFGGGSPRSAAVLDDFDGDGYPEIVSCGRSECIKLDAGQAGFVPDLTAPIPPAAVDVVSFDWGGDGDRDLVFVQPDGAPMILENTNRVGTPFEQWAGPERMGQRLGWAPMREAVLLVGAWTLPLVLVVGLWRDRSKRARLGPTGLAVLTTVMWWLGPMAGPDGPILAFVGAILLGTLGLAEAVRRRARALTLLDRFRVGGSWGLSVPAEPRSVAPVLGHGRSGTVVEAWDTALRHPVALKQLAVTSGEAAVALSEVGRQLIAVRSPHLVEIVDVQVSTHRATVVMALVPGATLASIVGRGRLSTALGLQILHDVLLGLSPLHDLAIVHGDLSLNNVMITPQGRAVVLDPGLARRAGQAALGYTPGFGAPEAQRGEPLTLRSDVYAAAALFESMTARATGSWGATEIIDRALASDPARRYVSAQAFRAALPPAGHREEVAALHRVGFPRVRKRTTTGTATWSP